MTKIKVDYVNAYRDRHGKPRYYFRRKGYPSVPLPAPGSAGFLAAYEAANAPVTIEKPAARVGFLPGSLGRVIEQFMASGEFADRADNTRIMDRRVFDELRRTFGAGLLCHLRDHHVKEIRNHFRDSFSTSTADAAISRLSVLWEYADQHLGIRQLGANPTVGIARLHKSKKKHEPWPDDVLSAFYAAAPSHLSLAVTLLLYTGQRRSDVVKMKWSQFDGEIIEVAQQKTGAFAPIPCHHRLKEILTELPRRSEFILTGERGHQYKADSLTKLVRDRLRAIGIRGYSVHGLRSNAAQALAEAGCSISEIMAITGHKSPGMAMHYAKRAEKKKLARNAMDRWEAAEVSQTKVPNLRTKAV